MGTIPFKQKFHSLSIKNNNLIASRYLASLVRDMAE